MSCALCNQKVVHHAIYEGEHAFCCLGCQAVFRILSAKNLLDNFQETALYKQAVRSGLISNPILLQQLQQKNALEQGEEVIKLHLEVSEMWCPACADLIRLVLLQERGVAHCVVDYSTDLAVIEFAPKKISKDKILQQIQELGYKPMQWSDRHQVVSRSLAMRFGVAAFCASNAMMFAYPIYASYFDGDPQNANPLLGWCSFLMTLPVLIYSAWPIWRRFFHSLYQGIFGMEMLIIIGITTAFGLSTYELWQGSHQIYFDSLCVIVTLVLLGKIIETKAKFSAKESLLTLSRMLPRKARRCLPNGSYAFVPVKDLQRGEHLIAFSGEKIVVDGIVIEGEGVCNESLMTGESVPIAKKPGDSLLGGSILQGGSLTYMVSALMEETMLHHILDVVQQEVGHKSVYIRAADQIVRWFVPVVCGIALLSAFLASDHAIVRAVSVLLISCPCAIGIAAPLAESCTMARLASLGVFVRNRGCLSKLGRETVFVFDKTGTITEGHFTILSGLETLSATSLQFLKGVATHSTHPISTAIVQAIDEPPFPFPTVEEFSGLGLRGIFKGETYLLGSAAFLQEQGLTIPNATSTDSLAYFAMKGKIAAVIHLGDRIRKEAKETIHNLKHVKTILLSGDRSPVVEAVAQACGFNAWKAQCTPIQKKDFIHSLRTQGHLVCMLGDGINDAPALTMADIAISVGTATEISIQVSDILLTTHRLSIVPQIREIARHGQRIVKQNLFWAFFYNGIGIGLAAFGYLTPLFAAFAMTTSSLMVLFNAKRLTFR